MFITKFNRLIQNRVVWAVILVLIVLAFVVWGTRGGGGKARRAARAPGKLNGEPVPPTEFQTAYRNAYLSFAMMTARMGISPDLTDVVDRRLRKEAWRQLAAMRRAQELGVVTDDQELAEMIRGQTVFQENGMFSRQRYAAFIRNMPARIAVTERQFEEHLRREQTMHKLRRIIGETATWTSPHEIAQRVREYTAEYVVDFAVLQMANYTQDVTVSREQAQSYFAENAESFEIPRKVSVRYVRFDYEHFMPEQEPDDTAVEEYYEEHLDDFTSIVTNAEPDAVQTNALEASDDPAAVEDGAEPDALTADPADSAASLAPSEEPDTPSAETNALASADPAGNETNSPESAEAESDTNALASAETTDDGLGTNVTTRTQPLEEVRADIVRVLMDAEARDAALYKAMEFVVELTPRGNEQTPAFEAVAATEAYARPVATSELFAVDEPLTNLQVGLELNRAAFELDPDNPMKQTSDAIEGEQAAFVVVLHSNVEARIPEFKEVESDVMPKAFEHYAQEAFTAKAQEIRDAAAAALAEGKTFEAAVSPFGLESVTTPPWTLFDGLEASEYARPLARCVRHLTAGELADVYEIPDGALLVYVAKRTTPEEVDPGVRNEVLREFGWKRSEYAFNAWQEYLLRAGEFEENVPDAEPVEGAAEGEEGEEQLETAQPDAAADETSPEPVEETLPEPDLDEPAATPEAAPSTNAAPPAAVPSD